MPKHRGLNRKRFLEALNPELLDRYFTSRIEEQDLPRRLWMTADLVDRFLNENPVDVGPVLEESSRINDLAQQGKGTLVWTYGRYKIRWLEAETPEDMAMRLFLDYKGAFQHAYAWYTWHSCASRMSECRMPADGFELTPERVAGFRESITDWFRGLAKGETTEVSSYEQDGLTVILVTHGSYVRTVAEWEGEKVTIRSFRPATEDILLYNPASGILQMKATLEKDRKEYLKAFAGEFLEDTASAEKAAAQPAYTLEPFRTGRFSFAGNAEITDVVLLEANLQLAGETEPKLHLKSKDLRRTLDAELKDLSLSMGELTYVKLRFFLRIDGKEVHENVEIAPPERSDLPTREHQEVIARYLQEQGVKLIWSTGRSASWSPTRLPSSTRRR